MPKTLKKKSLKKNLRKTKKIKNIKKTLRKNKINKLKGGNNFNSVIQKLSNNIPSFTSINISKY